MTRKEKLQRLLTAVFWGSLVFTLGFTWFYLNEAIPDRLNLVVDEAESFHFPLPVKVTLESDSSEVVVGNDSNIPAETAPSSDKSSFLPLLCQRGNLPAGFKAVRTHPF